MENLKITNKEAISLIFVIISNTYVYITDRIIIHSCSSSSLLNTVYISIIALLFTFFITLLFKNFPGKNIVEISETLGGKVLKISLTIIYYIYFIFLSSVILKKVSDCLQIIYYPMTNIIYIILLFILAAGVICSFRNPGIFKTTAIASYLLGIAIVVIFLLNMKNYDLRNIFPLFGNGLTVTFGTGLSNLFAFSGLSHLYFLPPILQKPEDFKKISLISIAISGFLLITTIANILFIYSHSLINIELFPLYISVRYIEFGTFLQRLDSIFLSFCIIASIIYISISTILCSRIWKKCFQLSDSRPIVYPSLLLIFAFSMNIKEYPILNFLEDTLSKYLFFTIPVLISSIILILANVKFAITKKRSEYIE